MGIKERLHYWAITTQQTSLNKLYDNKKNSKKKKNLSPSQFVLAACLFVCLFVCLFGCLTVCLSVYLSVCLTD